MKILPTLLASFVLLFISCGSNKGGNTGNNAPSLPDTTITNLYRLGTDGNYAAYVSRMASCIGTTEAYREQIILAVKHRNDCVSRERQGVKSVSVARTESHNNGEMVNAFLNVDYGDGSHEETIFPLVCVDGQWMMQ